MTPNYGGVEAVVMNWYRHIDRTKIQFDFLARHDGLPIAYEQEIKDLGGHIYRQYYGRKEKPFTAARYVERIFEEDPSIKGVHMNLNSLEYITPLRLASKRDLPVRIVHSHNSNNLNGTERIETRLMQMMNKKIIQSSEYLKLGCSREACKYMFGSGHSMIVHNAIELEKYRYNKDRREKLRKKNGIEDSTVVVGFVGRIQYQKNPIFLIKIFRELNALYNNTKMVIVGTGDMEVQCKRLVQTYGIEDKVLFLGMKKETADYYSMFDVFLLPSLFEGLGIVAIEAQASGLPCLISETIPADTMITTLIEKHSLSDSPKAWAEHLIEIINKKMRDREACDYSGQLALAGFDIKREAKVLENMYLSLIEEH